MTYRAEQADVACSHPLDTPRWVEDTDRTLQDLSKQVRMASAWTVWRNRDARKFSKYKQSLPRLLEGGNPAVVEKRLKRMERMATEPRRPPFTAPERGNGDDAKYGEGMELSLFEPTEQDDERRDLDEDPELQQYVEKLFELLGLEEIDERAGA